MKKHIKSLVLALILALGIVSPALAAGSGLITATQAKGAKIVGWPIQYKAVVTNNGPDPDVIRLQMHHSATDFVLGSYYVSNNTTGQTIYCQTPPVVYCYPGGNMAVGTEFQVTYIGHWNTAGVQTFTFTADHNASTPYDDQEDLTYTIAP